MAIVFLGLTIGDNGSGWTTPTYQQLRDALGARWISLRGAALNTAPGRFFGDMLDVVVTAAFASLQASRDAVSTTLFTEAEGVSLDRMLAPVTVRLPAVPSSAVVYAYGTPGANVPALSLVRASPAAPSFAFDLGVTVPAPAAALAWVFEIEDFAAGGAAGVTFTLTVNGSPYPVTAGPVDTADDIRFDLIAQVNAALLAQRGYLAGSLPNASPTRLAGLLRDDTSSPLPFPVLFTSTGPPSLTSVYTAAPGRALATVAGPTPAAAATLRQGQAFAGIVGYTNPLPAILGRLQETDSQLRARHQTSQRQGCGSPDAIRSAVLTPVERGGGGANYCSVEYNPEPVTDALGNVANSIRVTTDSDVIDLVIANVIWRVKAAGDNTNGAILTLITDAEGKSQPIRHDYLEIVYIWVEVAITPSETWPVLGNPLQQLQADLVDWINTLGGGGDVRVNSAPVSTLPNGLPRGVANFTIRVGSSTDPLGLIPPIFYQPSWPDVDPNADNASIPISSRQVSATDAARVTVNFI